MAHREKVFIDGHEAASVTTILNIVNKPWLCLWYGRMGLQKAQAILKDSQELGHLFHEAIEGYFRGDLAQDLPDDVAKMFSVFKGWAIDSRFTPLELEMPVQSKQYCYYGNLDAIGHFDDGQLIVVDWKTSAAIDNLYGAQLAAYAQAYQEQTTTCITEGLIVRVDKKTHKLEVKRFENLPSYFDVFLHCKALYDFVNKKAVA